VSVDLQVIYTIIYVWTTIVANNINQNHGQNWMIFILLFLCTILQFFHQCKSSHTCTTSRWVSGCKSTMGTWSLKYASPWWGTQQDNGIGSTNLNTKTHGDDMKSITQVVNKTKSVHQHIKEVRYILTQVYKHRVSINLSHCDGMCRVVWWHHREREWEKVKYQICAEFTCCCAFFFSK